MMTNRGRLAADCAAGSVSGGVLMETPVYSRTNKRDGLSAAVIRVDNKYRVTVREIVGDLVLVSRDFDDREAAIEYAHWFVA